MTLPFDSIFNHIGAKDRSLFVRQLSMMISGGIPIAQALTLISQQTINPRLRQAIRTMVQDVQHGQAFSVAAARFPDLFDEVMLAMLKTGEASGQLQRILEEIAAHTEAQISFTNKIRNALIYPAFIIFVMIVVAIIMTTVVIPRLNEVFMSSGVELPLTTRLLVGVSSVIINYWYIIIVMLVGIFFAFRAYFATPEGRLTLYGMQMAIPVLRELLMNSYLVRFTSVLAMLTRAGVPITEALRIVSQSMVNPNWVRAINASRQEVERGIPLSVALSRHQIFPTALTQMIGVGEQTGNMDSVLETMSKYYQEQTDNTIKAVTALIEPVILLVVALGVAFVVISVILPIYGLADQF